MLLNSKLPSACTGQPIVEVLGGRVPSGPPRRR